MTSNTQPSVTTGDGDGLFMAILVVAGIVAIGSALFVDVITDVPKELPLALVGPLFSGVTLALLLTQYNRRRRNSLVTAVDDLESRIAEQNAVIETQQTRIDDLESDIGELQGRNWGEYGSETRSSRSAAPRTARSSQSGNRSRDPPGEASQTAVGDGNASDSGDGPAEKGAERSSKQSAYHEDLVERVAVSADEPAE
jgi:hypothetical protein